MSILKLISEFQERFCNNLDECSQLLDVDYAIWSHFKQLILTVAEKLGNPSTFENLDMSPNLNLFPGCMYTLMTHEFKPRNWDVASFVLFLNYLDPQLTKMFLCIIHGITSHPVFGPYSVNYRKNCRMKLGYTRIYSDVIEYTGFEFYDALVEINRYFMKFIPFYRPMAFFQSRLPLCVLDVAEFRKSSSHQRQKMLMLSGLSRLLVRKLCYFKDTQLSSQMKTIMLRNF
jgi:hypothetical protein